MLGRKIKSIGLRVLRRVTASTLAHASDSYRDSFILGLVTGHLVPNISRDKITDISVDVSKRAKTVMNVDVIALGVLLSKYVIPARRAEDKCTCNMTCMYNTLDRTLELIYDERTFSYTKLNNNIVKRLITVYPYADMTRLVKSSVASVLGMVDVTNKKVDTLAV